MINNTSYFLGEGEFTRRGPLVNGLVDRIRSDTSSDNFHFVLTNIIKNELDKCPEDVAKYEIFRKRTAEEVLESGFQCGCTDRGIVFASVMRGLGVPTRYVETLNKSWIEFNPTDEQRNNAFEVNYSFADFFWPRYDSSSSYEESKELDKELYEVWMDSTGDDTLPLDRVRSLVMYRGFIREMHVLMDLHIDGEWKKYDVIRGFRKDDTYNVREEKYVEIAKGLDFSELYFRKGEGYFDEPYNMFSTEEICDYFFQGRIGPEGYYRPTRKSLVRSVGEKLGILSRGVFV